VRNSAGKFETSTEHVSHLFDGCAQLHAFSFKKGKVSYANKFLKTNYYEKALQTGSFSKGFTADPCPLVFKRVLSYFRSRGTTMEFDNANVNVSKIADKFVALTETPLPIEFNLNTLETVGHMSFDDTLKGHVTTAHPHTDVDSGELFNYLTHFGRESSYLVYAMPLKGNKRRLLATVPVEKPSYMHSFGITKNFIILTEIPFRVNPLHLLFMNKPFIKNFVWNPEEGTIFTVINRNNGEITGRFKAEPFFTFHHVNAFEQDGLLMVDLIAYKDASHLDELSFENLFKQGDKRLTKRPLTRFVVDIKKGLVTSRVLSNRNIEMPRINYQAYNMKPYTYVYAIEFTHNDDKLVKINVETGAVVEWKEKGCSPGEPVFIAAPRASTEDDGVIVSVILDAYAKSSFLLVLDARTFKERARARVPHHIPFQIHGEFFGD
nr:carotenoid oxygenase family protein [Candidatus Dependentiae bacterium]